MKRYLYLWHRWLGIVTCVFMALWFVSGMVMLYVGYPKLTPREHLAHLPALSAQGCCVSLGEALAVADPQPARIRLSSVAGQALYLFDYASGKALAVDATSGQRIAPTTRERALASAGQYDPHAPLTYRDAVQEDLWSHSRALDAHRPLHRVQLSDTDGTLLYISGQTGEVVRDASASERGWNLIGAWLHWLYPLRGIGLDGLWSNLVIYLSLAASVMALLGAVVGVMRWRFSRPYRSGSRSPYKGWARWHHVGGLLFGALAITWIFSGLMSMNPWRLFSSAQPLDTSAYQGGPLNAAAFPLSVPQALARFADQGFTARELEWRLIGGAGYVVARTARDARGYCRCTTARCCSVCHGRCWSRRRGRSGRRCRCSSWRPTTSTTTRGPSRACSGILKSVCRCCGCASTTRRRPGCIWTCTPVKYWGSWTSHGARHAGCSRCCTAGTGYRC